MALTPFAVRIIDNKKTEDNNPPRGLFCMSKKISEKKVSLLLGTNISMKFNKIESKLSIGIKGIKFKMKSKKGKIAIKKLKEILPARAVKAPFINPKKYISKRSYKENPLKPGNLIEFKKFFNNFKCIYFYQR